MISGTFFGHKPPLTCTLPVQVPAAQSRPDERIQPEALLQSVVLISAQGDARDSKRLHQDFSYDVAWHTEYGWWKILFRKVSLKLCASIGIALRNSHCLVI